MLTNMRSKENTLLELIFNTPQHWHFEELQSKAHISPPQLMKWLKVFQKEGILKRIKERSKMPYYIQDFSNPKFGNRKKLFAMKKMTESGFFDHLASLSQAKVIILFGSFTRSDWNKESDIDIFIYGKDDELDQGKYETILHREIQLFAAHNKDDFRKMDHLLPSILSGNIIKGSIHDLEIELHAKA